MSRRRQAVAPGDGVLSFGEDISRLTASLHGGRTPPQSNQGARSRVGPLYRERDGLRFGRESQHGRPSLAAVSNAVGRPDSIRPGWTFVFPGPSLCPIFLHIRRPLMKFLRIYPHLSLSSARAFPQRNSQCKSCFISCGRVAAFLACVYWEFSTRRRSEISTLSSHWVEQALLKVLA